MGTDRNSIMRSGFDSWRNHFFFRKWLYFTQRNGTRSWFIDHLLIITFGRNHAGRFCEYTKFKKLAAFLVDIYDFLKCSTHTSRDVRLTRQNMIRNSFMYFKTHVNLSADGTKTLHYNSTIFSIFIRFFALRFVRWLVDSYHATLHALTPTSASLWPGRGFVITLWGEWMISLSVFVQPPSRATGIEQVGLVWSLWVSIFTSTLFHWLSTTYYKGEFTVYGFTKKIN